MPILDIEIVGDANPAEGSLAQRLADATGAVLGSDPQSTWVRLRHLPRRDYAENGGMPAGARPVFVSVLRRRLPEPEILAGEAARLAACVAGLLGRASESVHVIYEPPGAGRVAFGGVLLRDAETEA